MAWKRGVKSLYYCRSLSIQRADNVSEAAVAPAAFIGAMGVPLPVNDQAQLPLVARAVTSVGANATDYEECLACQ
jgi:ribonucleoside-diphosphate reductase alpha chain